MKIISNFVFSPTVFRDGETFRSWSSDEDTRRFLDIGMDWDKYYAYAESNPNYYLFTVRYEGKIVAITGIEYADGQWNSLIVVAPKYRGNGYGTVIFSRFLSDIRSLTGKVVSTVYATSEDVNIASRRLLEKCGFMQTGKDKDDFWVYEYTNLKRIIL